jgi:uncharacterized protein YcnI
LLLAAVPRPAFAHIEVAPAESGTGETLRYGIRVPTEKPAPTVRVEVQFPNAVRVLDVEATAGWQVVVQTDTSGRPVDAVWQGGSVPPNQFVEFGVRARNPEGDSDLRWSVIQTYEDGSEVQWVGPASADSPAAITRVRSRALFGAAEILAALATLLALAALIVALIATLLLKKPSTLAGGGAH